jgi:glucose-1-phosphate cytidylyltransferase
MKVVLFCGGLGTRLREYSETVPKPMVEVGSQPILWHLMKYYAHFGHTEFILCLGYRGDYIKRYFVEYSEWMSNDFRMGPGGAIETMTDDDVSSWSITFVDTGLASNIGERLVAVRHLLDSDEMFLANYSDGLTDLDLGEYLRWFESTGKTASFVSVRPSATFHPVHSSEDGTVTSVQTADDREMWINGGYFALRREIFDHIEPGEELVEEPFGRLIKHGDLVTMRHPGFWACMDTYKEKKMLDAMYERQEMPWAVWR